MTSEVAFTQLAKANHPFYISGLHIQQFRVAVPSLWLCDGNPVTVIYSTNHGKSCFKGLLRGTKEIIRISGKDCAHFKMMTLEM